MEVDIGGKLEKNVFQDGAQVHEVKNSVTCSVPKRLEVDNVGSSNAISEIVMDVTKGDIITESEVIVSFSSNSAESNYAVDQIDGAIGSVNGSVPCDPFSHGSGNIALDEEKSTSDQEGNGIGRIRFVHSDRGGNVDFSLGPGNIALEQVSVGRCH